MVNTANHRPRPCVFVFRPPRSNARLLLSTRVGLMWPLHLQTTHTIPDVCLLGPAVKCGDLVAGNAAVSQVCLRYRYSSDGFLVTSYDTLRHARHLDKNMCCGFLFGQTEVANIVLTLLRMEKKQSPVPESCPESFQRRGLFFRALHLSETSTQAPLAI